jgi:hypothetical protein
MAFGDWLSGVESRPGPFRVIQRWGPNLVRHSAVLGEYHQCAAAFECFAQRTAACLEAGGRADALRLVVVDGNWHRVESV